MSTTTTKNILELAGSGALPTASDAPFVVDTL